MFFLISILSSLIWYSGVQVIEIPSHSRQNNRKRKWRVQRRGKIKDEKQKIFQKEKRKIEIWKMKTMYGILLRICSFLGDFFFKSFFLLTSFREEPGFRGEKNETEKNWRWCLFSFSSQFDQLIRGCFGLNFIYQFVNLITLFFPFIQKKLKV